MSPPTPQSVLRILFRLERPLILRGLLLSVLLGLCLSVLRPIAVSVVLQEITKPDDESSLLTILAPVVGTIVIEGLTWIWSQQLLANVFWVRAQAILSGLLFAKYLSVDAVDSVDSVDAVDSVGGRVGGGDVAEGTGPKNAAVDESSLIAIDVFGKVGSIYAAVDESSLIAIDVFGKVEGSICSEDRFVLLWPIVLHS